MISGATRGGGGRALGAHVADAKEVNEETRLGASRGLIGDTIRDQVAELTAMASHSRAAQPIYHMHADPPDGAEWSERQWDRYWSLFEQEFGLERAAFGEQVHTKEGREHRHREYLLVRPDGTTNPMRHDFARREKLSRILEHETGAPMVKGAFNKKVVEFLRRDGREDVAAAMKQAGLLDGPKPRAAMTPRERAQAERTGVDPREVGAKALAAWAASDDGRSFRQALLASGLRLAQGDRAPVIVDAAGGTHPVARLLGKESGAAGLERIPAAAVSARLADLDLAALPEGGRGRKRDLEALALRDPAETLVHEKAAPAGAAGPAEEGKIVHTGEMVLSAPEPVLASVPEAPAAVSAASEPAAPPASPLSSGGGGGGGGTGSDEVAVEALDPSRPDDLARFLSQTAAAEKRKERRLAQVDDRVSKDAQAKAAEAAKLFGARIQEFFDAAAEQHQHNEQRTEHNGEFHETAHLGLGGRDSGGHSASGAGPEGAEYVRPQKPEPDRIRGSFRGPGRAQPLGAEDIAGSGDRAGAGADAADAFASGAGRSEPSAAGGEPGTHGAVAGTPGAPTAADRLRSRRQAQVLAEAAGRCSDRLRALTDLLAGTPERIAADQARIERRERIQEALSRSEQRIGRVLSRAPYPDPASREPDVLADEERACVKLGLDQAKATAREARSAAADARERIGILGRLGVPTAARREADAAEQAAQAAEDGAEEAERRMPDGLRDADRRAQARAELRGEEQAKWERGRDARQARLEEHGNELVRKAVEDGDPEIERLAADDLGQAREEMLRREEEQRQQEERARLERERERANELEHQAEPELEHAHGGGPRGGGAPAPEPRRR